MHITNRQRAGRQGARFLLVGSFALSMLKFRRDLLGLLVQKGVEVHASVPISESDAWIIEELEGVGVILHGSSLCRTGMNPLRDIFSLYEYWALMRKIRPTHVLSYTIKPIIYASLAARASKVPNRFALITGRGYAFERRPRKLPSGNLAQWMYRLALRNVTSIFFQNKDDEALFRSRGLVLPSTRTMVVNGSGVSLDEYAVAPFPKGVSFLLIARLLGAKGIREFVKASRIVKDIEPNAQFRVVGWLDENPDAIEEEELEQWKAEGIVEFLGRKDDVRPAISASTVYVLPSYREGTPRSVLEAMSMGRPIITTDAPGCREPVQDGRNGYLVPVRSVDELAAAMLRFIEHPLLVEEMGRRSREIAEERYDVQKVNRIMVDEMGLT